MTKVKRPKENLIINDGKKYMKLLGKGQNYENHNVENQKEHQKSWRRSLHRKDL